MEQKHFWHVGRREIILDVLRKNVSNLAQSRMLEVGCGNGSILAFLRQNGINIEGGDIFLEGLRFCRQRASSVPLYQIDALSLPFNNDYEIIGLFDVLEHIENDEKALGEISMALKAGGNLVLTVPAYKLLWSRHDEASRHKRRYSRTELIAKLERCGFVVNKATYYMFFLFPVLATMRLLSKIFRNKKHEKDDIQTSLELKTIPVINNAFLASLRLEKYLVRYLNLPFGASLLVVAAKKMKKDSLGSELIRLYNNQDVYIRFYVKARSRLLKLDYYLKFLPRRGLIIDVGCGYGVLANYMSLYLPDSQIIGIDLNIKRIDAALKTIGSRKNINFLAEDATQWVWPDCTGISMTDFLHHVSPPEQEKVLHKAFQSLKKDGVLLISEVDTTAKPAYRYWASYLSDRFLYPLTWSYFRKPSELTGILSRLGFKVETINLSDRIFAGILYICRKS
jgi:2-polyprenyl-3-methyl-5-hydroxy-6-metoxy-1,4-benzoquinol methylase